MSNWIKERLARATAFDLDASREEYRAEGEPDAVYPKLCGALQYHLKEAIAAAESALEELEKVRRRKDALEWAAENVLGESQFDTYDSRCPIFEELYAAADVVEKAIKGGMTDDQLRDRLKDGIREDELKEGHFIDDVDRCCGCEEFKELDEDGNCEDCAEELEGADSPTG
jgi:hypothetical protein